MGEAGGQGRWERMGSREAGLGDYKTDIVMIIIELEKLFQNRDIFHCQLSTGFFSSVFHYYKKHNCAITFKNCKNAMFFNVHFPTFSLIDQIYISQVGSEMSVFAEKYSVHFSDHGVISLFLAK